MGNILGREIMKIYDVRKLDDFWFSFSLAQAKAEKEKIVFYGNERQECLVKRFGFDFFTEVLDFLCLSTP